MKHPRKPALAPLLRKWQQRLRLRDWHITAQYVQQRDKPTDNYVGRVSYSRNKAEARICILDPAVEPHDVEFTFKHEMLHLVLCDIVRDDGDGALEERVIERLVPLLLK